MGKNWAIEIGINNYSNLWNLKYAKADAEAMRDWFQQEAKFDEVFLFTEDSPDIPARPSSIPTNPTYGHIRRFLRSQFEKPLLKPGDNLWFFFAGHGRRDRERDYLMLSDSDPGDVEHTAISVEYVTQRLRRWGAGNVVLFLDACRDEGSRGGLGIGEEEHKGVITFYSCTANQKSWEIDELQHGSFTHTLLEGLQLHGEANCATVERLNRYLYSQVPKLNAHYNKPSQNPYLKAAPPYKMYYILLEQSATLKDAEPLKYQASIAENRGDFVLAKQLWKRVLALPGVDEDAWEAIERIAQKQRDISRTPLNSQSIVEQKEETIRQQQEVEKNQEVTKSESVVTPKLQAFEFEVVTVNIQRKWWGLGTEIKLNRSHSQAQYFTEDLGNGVELDMVSIPGSKFMMGTEDKKIERLVQKFNLDVFRREKPQHEVTVQPFFVGKYPITQAQWREISSLPKDKHDLQPYPSYFKGDDRPVERVSWEEAIEFCQRLSRQTGKEYRLPTEAEWEYACRAGTTTPFHFGETITTDLANYNGNYTYANEPKGQYLRQTTPVGRFPPNAFGLYDMHGNVWEWCEDDWHDNYQGAPTDGSAWRAGISNLKVVCGGSWFDLPNDCRSAYRDSFIRERDVINNGIGFRVVSVAGRTT